MQVNNVPLVGFWCMLDTRYMGGTEVEGTSEKPPVSTDSNAYKGECSLSLSHTTGTFNFHYDMQKAAWPCAGN